MTKTLAVDCRVPPLALVVAFAGLWVVEVLWEGLFAGGVGTVEFE